MSLLAQLWDQVADATYDAVGSLRTMPGPKPNPEMCRFLVLGEDHRIKSHIGVDPIALGRSAWKTFLCGKTQGGSTIAMQLVRTITGRYQRTAWRKYSEIELAIRLTRTFDLADLTRVYLWLAYYGWGMHGFQEACAALSLCPEGASEMEAAMLVARLKYPQPKLPNPIWAARIEHRARHLISLDFRSFVAGSQSVF